MFYKKAKEIVKLRDRVMELELELKQAKNLQGILDKLVSKDFKLTTSGGIAFVNGISGGNIQLTDDVAVYVDDLFGGKVLKQEANKALRIELDGKVTTGYTKKPCDKGYHYKLVRV